MLAELRGGFEAIEDVVAGIEIEETTMNYFLEVKRTLNFDAI